MALDFGTLGQAREVDHGTLSSENFSAGTFIFWAFVTDQSTFDITFFSKSAEFRFATDDANNWALRRNRATANINVISNSYITTNAWNFVAGVFDSAGADGDQRLYIGDDTTTVVEVSSYATQVVGSGALNDITGSNFLVGDGPSFLGPFGGRIAVVGMWNTVLTLGQIRSLQWFPRNLFSPLLLCQYGFNGTGTQADLSGNGNAGTVTGATVIDHVPLGPPFGFDVGLLVAVLAAGNVPMISPRNHPSRNLLLRM